MGHQEVSNSDNRKFLRLPLVRRGGIRLRWGGTLFQRSALLPSEAIHHPQHDPLIVRDIAAEIVDQHVW